MRFDARFRNSIPIRYGEVDQQGVVFNAHYLAYCDDTLERWIDAAGDLRALGWDMMLKRATIDWQGSASARETLDVDAAVTRWGRTSFELGYMGTVGGRDVFTAAIVYVSVRLGLNEAYETPPQVVAHLGPAVEPPGGGTA
jgi:acyl-CoA thioester hydrolase